MSANELRIPASGSVSTEQTQVEGDIKIRVIILNIVGAILILLILGGIAGLAIKPEVFGSYWSTVLPIISGAVFGLIGFVVGRKVGPEK
jgi:hypothetical protein